MTASTAFAPTSTAVHWDASEAAVGSEEERPFGLWRPDSFAAAVPQGRGTSLSCVRGVLAIALACCWGFQTPRAAAACSVVLHGAGSNHSRVFDGDFVIDSIRVGQQRMKNVPLGSGGCHIPNWLRRVDSYH